MIYIERTITIDESSAYIEDPIVLYKGDRNIEVQFIIKNSPFKHKAGIDLTYGQLIIKRPATNPIFSEVAKVSSSKVLFVITGDMIDELAETGNYDFQIRLLNSDLSSRATLPPVTAGFMVKEPICEESVNTAPVNYSRAVIDREVEGTFDEEGNYNKTDWSNGDIITDSKLNKIEDALYTINDNNSDYATKDDIPTDVSAFTNDAGYINDISHLAAKDELPTNVSELTNDAGYLTEHQSLEAYALKTDIPSTDGLATEQYVDDAVANVDVDLTGYATEAYVQDAIDAIEIPEGGGNVDLTGYATEQFVNDAISNMPKEIPTVSGSKRKMSQLQSDFATEGFYYLSGVSIVCVDPITGLSKGTISLEDGLYYSRIGTDPIHGGARVSLYSYTTHATYDIDEYVDSHNPLRSGLSCTLVSSDFVTQSELSNYATQSELSAYATKDEVIGTISGTITSSSTDTSLTSKLPEGLHLFKDVKISCKKTETAISTTSLALDDDIVRVSRYEDTEGNRGTITELYCYGSSTTYKFYVKKGSIINSIILLSQESNTTDLSGYATKDELQTALGDIESLLGGI